MTDRTHCLSKDQYVVQRSSTIRSDQGVQKQMIWCIKRRTTRCYGGFVDACVWPNSRST